MKEMDEFTIEKRKRQMLEIQTRNDALGLEADKHRFEFWFKPFDMDEARSVAAEVGFTDIEFGRSLWAWKDVGGFNTVPKHRDAAFLQHLGYYIESSMWDDPMHNIVETVRVMSFYESFYPIACDQFPFDMQHGVEYSRGALLYPELEKFLREELPRMDAERNRKRRKKALKRMRSKQPNNRTLRTA